MFTVTLTSYGQTQISDLVQIDGIILLYEYVSDISSISNISSYTQVLDEDSAGNIKNNICNVLISDSSSSEYQAHTILFYKNNGGTKNILCGYSAEEPFIKKSASSVNLWFSFDFSAFTNGFALSAIKAGFANASHNEDGLLHLENPNTISDDNYSVYNKSQVDALLQDKQSTLSAGDGIAISNGTVKTTGIPFGIVDNTSTATVFTVTVPGIYKLEDGVCCLLKNGVITSATGFTLEVNGLGAKPVYSNMAAATRETTIFNVNYTMLFVYDSTRIEGGAWICYRGYFSDANSIAYQIRGNVHTLPTTAKFYRYRLLFTSADGTHFVPSNTSTSTNATAKRDVVQTPIDPFGEIVYYSTTTAVEANANPGPTYLWTQYAITFGYSFNRTGATLTLTSFSPVYIKCAPQSNGSAIIDADTPYVQALPNAADGKIYIFLGVANSATAVELLNNHPIYYHDGTGIRIWHGKDSYSKSELDTIIADYVQTSRTINNKPLTSDITLTLDDVSDGTNRSIPTVNNSTITIKKNSSDTGDTFTTNAASNKTINLGLATVATSGSYNDLSNKPTIPTVNNSTITIKKNSSDTGDSFTTNAASGKTINLGLSTVATSGSYNDLSNKPTIPVVPEDVSAFNNDAGYLTSYTETDPTVPSWAKQPSKPTYTASEVGALPSTTVIPTVNNSTITIKKNSSDTGDSFTTNASSAKTINLGLHAVATSGSYNDLSNKPTIPTVNNAKLTIKKNSSDTGIEFTANASSDVTCNLNLATVATSGSYNDLSNKPTIPTVNNATLTIQKNGTSVGTFTANASSNATANITVPLESISVDGTIQTITNRNVDLHIPADITNSDFICSMTRTNVSGSGNLSLSGIVGPFPVSGTPMPVGTYRIRIRMRSTTSSYSLTVNFGGSYTLTSSGGVIDDIRTVTLSSASTFSASVTQVNANTYIKVSIYEPDVIVTDIGAAAVTNDYNDLENIPNGTLIIQRNGSNVASFSASATSNVTANITVPTTTSQLTNNSGFITSSDLPTNHVTTNTNQSITGQKTFVTATGGGTGNDIKIAFVENAQHYITMASSAGYNDDYISPYFRMSFIGNSGDLSTYIETKATYTHNQLSDEYDLTDIVSASELSNTWSLGSNRSMLKSIYTSEINNSFTNAISFASTETTFNKEVNLVLAKDTNTYIYGGNALPDNDYRHWWANYDQVNMSYTSISMTEDVQYDTTLNIPIDELSSVTPFGRLIVDTTSYNLSIGTTSVTSSLKSLIESDSYSPLENYVFLCFDDSNFTPNINIIGVVICAELTNQGQTASEKLMFFIPFDDLELVGYQHNPSQGTYFIVNNSGSYSFSNNYNFNYRIITKTSIKDYVNDRVNSIVSSGVDYASSAGNASNIYVSTSSLNYSYPLVFANYANANSSLSDNHKSLYTDTVNAVYYNPYSNTLTCPTFNGNLTGNATNATNLKYLSTNVLSATSTTQVTSYGNIVPDNAGTLRYIGTLNNKWGGVYTSQIIFNDYTDSDNHNITPNFLVDSTNSEASYRGIKVAGNFKPSANNTFSLGNIEHSWKNIYANGINDYYIEIGNCTSVDDNNNIETQEPVIRPSNSGWGYLGTPKKHFYRAYIDNLYIGTSTTTLSSYIASTTVNNATNISLLGNEANGNFPLIFTYSVNSSTESAQYSQLYTSTSISSLRYNPSSDTLTCTNFSGIATSATYVICKGYSSSANKPLVFADSINNDTSTGQAKLLYTDTENSLYYNPSSSILYTSYVQPRTNSTSTSTGYNLGATSYRWRYLYARYIGSSDYRTESGYFNSLYLSSNKVHLPPIAATSLSSIGTIQILRVAIPANTSSGLKEAGTQLSASSYSLTVMRSNTSTSLEGNLPLTTSSSITSGTWTTLTRMTYANSSSSTCYTYVLAYKSA